MDKVTYSPAEFAAVFGKERTWGYRQLYAGKVKALTELGRTMIPKSEVDRLLSEAGRYMGAKWQSEGEQGNASKIGEAKIWSNKLECRNQAAKVTFFAASRECWFRRCL